MSGCPSGSGSATRCALYDGMMSTRHCGRQSSSRRTRRAGRSRVISVATVSRKPRRALTGLPSGAVIDDGTRNGSGTTCWRRRAAAEVDAMLLILPAASPATGPRTSLAA